MIGSLLKTWRRTAQLTQTQLAQALGVSQSLVSRWERGVEAPSPALSRRLHELMTGSRNLSELAREAVALHTLPVGRALYDVDGVRLLAYSQGFARTWPPNHGGKPLETIAGRFLLDLLVGEVASLLQDDEIRYQIQTGEIIQLSCVTERSTTLEVDHGLRYRKHGSLRDIGGRLVFDVTYEVCDRSVALGCSRPLTVEDVLSGRLDGWALPGLGGD